MSEDQYTEHIYKDGPIEQLFPNPFTTDYQYTDGPLDLYSDAELKKFANRLIKECAKIIKSQANNWGTARDDLMNEAIIDSSKALIKHFGIEDDE